MPWTTKPSLQSRHLSVPERSHLFSLSHSSFGAFAIFILLRLTAKPNLSWWHAITDLGIGNCKHSSLAPTGAGLTPAHHCSPTCDNSSILTSLLGHLPFHAPEEWVAKTWPPFLYQWFLTGHTHSFHSLTNSLIIFPENLRCTHKIKDLHNNVRTFALKCDCVVPIPSHWYYRKRMPKGFSCIWKVHSFLSLLNLGASEHSFLLTAT